MVEGRDDTLVHLHYVELIRPQDMCRVLTVNRKKIKVGATSPVFSYIFLLLSLVYIQVFEYKCEFVFPDPVDSNMSLPNRITNRRLLKGGHVCSTNPNSSVIQYYIKPREFEKFIVNSQYIRAVFYHCLDDYRAEYKYELADIVFAESIELLRLAYSLLSKATSHTVDNLFYFSKGWHDAQNEHVAFFAKQTINVEVVRGDTEIQVYFPRPRESRFLSPREQKRLMDIMEFGEDNALAAFTSPESRNIAEELRTRHILAQNATYEWMTENQTFIRQAMFVVCFYINFVMVLGLAIDPDDSEPVVHIYSYWTLSGLGGVFCILCSSLWLYNIATEMSFSYARQKLKPVKLRRMTLQDMTSQVWSAIAESCYAIGMFRSCGWVAVYAAITMVYGMDDSLTYITAGVSLAYVLYIVLLAIRKVSGIFHFAYITDDKVRNRQVAISNVLFWFNAVVDTLIKDNVVVFTLYTLCAFMGLSSDVSKRAYVYYGFPLLDILAINGRLSNI
ncbi:hypothetical protein AaE_003859, partial [Aphanomyces astaci]